MERLKADEKVRELLTVTGFDDESIEAIEDSFWLQAKKNREQQAAAEEAKPLTKMQMARKARVINPMKTEVSGSLMEMARAARIVK